MSKTTWRINVIGEQNLAITNGAKTIYKEMDWLKGEGVYVRKNGYSVPTLNDLWDEIQREDHKLDGIQYADFMITRYDNGFIFRLEAGYENIMSDDTANAGTLFNFIELLDETIIRENEVDGSITEQKLLTILSKLEEATETEEVIYAN